ncbi:MAG: hypothetical protein KDC05_13960, partial [Bacteroidales bacterium]|nr:hypothetical protein [Bacteroidales bacterium]
FAQLGLLLLLGVVPVVGTVIYLFDLNDVGRLDYGGMDGFWNVSVKNLTNFLVGNLSVYLNILIILFFAGMIILFFYLTLKKSQDDFIDKLLHPKFLFFYLLMGNLLGFFLEHHMFGILYPEERTSIQFILFFLGSLIFLLDRLEIRKQVLPAIVLIPFAFFPIQFVYSLNFDRSLVDTFNYNIPESFYEKVRDSHNPDEFPPTVQGYALRIMKWNYFNFMKDGEESCIHFNSYPSTEGDFQIVIPGENPEWLQYYDIIDVDKHNELHLLERKHKIPREKIFEKTAIKTDGEINSEFFEFAREDIDTLKGESLYFGFKVNLASQHKPFHGWLVITVFSDQNEQLRYEFIPFDWYRTDWTDPSNTFINGQLVHRLPENTKSYVAYIWNIYKQEYRLDHAELSIFRLKKTNKI